MVRPRQSVNVQDFNGQHKTMYLALLDTGARRSLISRSIVDECNLGVTNHTPVLLKGVDGQCSTVQESVKPTWEFSGWTGWHNDIVFGVVSQLPTDIDMILGQIAQEQLGINLYICDSACVAQEDSLGSIVPIWWQVSA